MRDVFKLPTMKTKHSTLYPRIFSKVNLLKTALLLPLPATVMAAGMTPTDDTKELSGVTVSAQALGDETISASMGVVVSEQLEQRPVSRAGELLETVPGLIVTQHSGEGKANQYFLRGFNLDHGTDMATFIDGMPVNNRTHGHGQGYTDINFIIPEMIESLNYKKGPFFGLEGDFANAGVARLHTKSSMDHSLFKVALGEFGYQRSLIASGGENWVSALDYTQYDGPWQEEQELEKTSFFAKRTLGNSVNGASVSVMGFENDWIATDQLPQRYVDAGGDRYDSLDNDAGGETHRYSLNVQGWKDVAGKPLNASAYVIDYGLKLYANHTYALDTVNGDEMHQQDERITSGGAVDYLFLENGSGNWTIGFDVRHDDIKDVGLSGSNDRQVRERVIRHSVDETSLGLALIHDYKWSESFVTQWAMRWDYIQADVKNKLTGETSDKSDQIVSPKFNARYKVTNDTYVFANYGFGYHSNDARGFADGNVDDSQEKANVFARSVGADLGVQSQLTEELQASVSLWWLTLESELIFVADDGTTEASEKSERLGAEASVFWQPTNWLILDSDLAFTRARLVPDEGAQQHIPGAIERVFSLGVTVHDAGQWDAGLRLRHFGEFALNEDNSERADAVTMVNVQVGYDVTPKLNLSMDLINLTNEEGNDITYLYESQMEGEAAPVEDEHFHPVEPRMVRVSMSFKF